MIHNSKMRTVGSTILLLSCGVSAPQRLVPVEGFVQLEIQFRRPFLHLSQPATVLLDVFGALARQRHRLLSQITQLLSGLPQFARFYDSTSRKHPSHQIAQQERYLAHERDDNDPQGLDRPLPRALQVAHVVE